MPKVAANITMLFKEYPFLTRIEKAAEAGFKGVEFLFPYEYESRELKKRLYDNQLEPVLFNLPPGNWEEGERGIACLPDRRDEFRRGVEQAVRYAVTLGCNQINCLAGLIPKNLDEERAWDTLVNNVCFAADLFLSEGIMLMVEAINSRVDMPGFLIDSSTKAFDLLRICQKKKC
jgi:hydroxypyruvate isomerase